MKLMFAPHLIPLTLVPVVHSEEVNERTGNRVQPHSKGTEGHTDAAETIPVRHRRTEQVVALPSKAGQAGGAAGGGNENKKPRPDVGVLQARKGRRRLPLLGDVARGDGGNGVTRFLQTFTYTTKEQLCIEGACAPFYCDCYANSWANNETDVVGEVPCAAETADLCNGYTDADGKSWSADGCFGIIVDFAVGNDMLTKSACEAAKCDVNGGTLGQCICQSSNVVCANYGALYDVCKIEEENINTGKMLFLLFLFHARVS